MKSNTRDVLAVSLTSSTSYSSGQLDVGDLRLLLISLTTISGGGTFIVNSVDANGHLYQLAQIGNGTGSAVMVVVGESSTYVHASASSATNTGTPYFGDKIQIDQVSGTIDVDISVKGK